MAIFLFVLSPFETYYSGNTVVYNDIPYVCLAENGYKFGNIRIPTAFGWIEIKTSSWQPTNYKLWEVVEYQGELLYTNVF